MTTYKKQLKDKDGNTIYPDVGLDLDSVVYSDDPEPVENPEPWIEPSEIKWSTFPKCKAYSETKTTIGNKAYFALDQLKYNIGGFSISGGVVTIPKTGKYLVSGWVSGMSGGVISGFVQLRTTGGKIFGSALNRPSTDIYCSIMIPATICDLSQGDRIGIYNLDQSFQQNAGIDTGFFGTQLNIIYIGD